MITARILSIGGGGGGADAGGGGAGGLRDVSNVQLNSFTPYNVVVGLGGGSTANGGDSYVAPKNGIIETATFTLSNGFSVDTEEANISAVANGEEVWVEVVVSNTDERDVDGVSVSIQGNTLAGLVYDGIYHYNVTSIVAGRITVTLVTSPNSCQPTVTFKFSTGYKIKSIGGGHGGRGGIMDGNGEKGKQGGSGGGGGTANSNDNGGAGGSAVSGQGNAGGSGAPSKGTNPSHDNGAGGGGGAGGAGESANGTNGYGGKDGGVGLASDITGSSVFYAGGGAGYAGSPNALGTPGNGQANAGGGGNGNNGSGKNGVIIIRYTIANVPHTFIGGTITNVGGDRIHTFTTNGVLEPFLPVSGAMALL